MSRACSPKTQPHGGDANGPRHDLIARKHHVELPTLDVELIGTIRCFVEVKSCHRDGDKDQQDQQAKINDRQEV